MQKRAEHNSKVSCAQASARVHVRAPAALCEHAFPDCTLGIDADKSTHNVDAHSNCRAPPPHQKRTAELRQISRPLPLCATL